MFNCRYLFNSMKIILKDIHVVVYDFIVILKCNYSFHSFNAQSYICQLSFFPFVTIHHAYLTLKLFNMTIWSVYFWFFLSTTELFGLFDLFPYSLMNRFILIYSCKGIHFTNLLYSKKIPSWCLHRSYFCSEKKEVLDDGRTICVPTFSSVDILFLIVSPQTPKTY